MADKDPITPSTPDHGPSPVDPAGPLPAVLVSMQEARERRAAQASASTEPPADTPKDEASEPDTKAGKKKEKTIDWGKYAYLIETFALIYGTDTVWDGASRLIMKIANMAHAYGSDMVKMWKGSESRRTVMPQDVVFDPTETCDPERCVNLFGGIAMEPREGDVSPFLELVRYLTSRVGPTADDSDAIMHWVLCWMAYPLQHRGTKLKTAIVMHGDEGAGKNFLWDTLVMIYGQYGTTVGQDELEDKFNDWRSGKLLVVGDEVSSRQELVHNKNRLKALITSPTVQINPKNLPRREERNHINIVFLSNELQPQALDNTDRRYMVVFTPPAREPAFYQRLGAWRKDDGPAKLYHYLLNYPLEGFDPYAPAPITEAKQDLIDLNRKSPERFWREWAAGELDLPYWSCSVAQAYQAYLKYCQRTGERYPQQRNMFTRMVTRMSETERKAVREKVMKVGDVGNRVCMRMLLVTDPPDDTPQGEWATGCVEAFELELKKFMGYRPHSPGDGSDGDGGGV